MDTKVIKEKSLLQLGKYDFLMKLLNLVNMTF